MHMILLACFAFVFMPAPFAQADTKPNVLFIAIDDLRPELGCYGSPIARTPHIDKLAKRGLVFTRAYCNVPVCGASRASLFTGLYPIGTKRFVNYDTQIDRDAPDAVTLPQAFKQAGYTTISNGKIYHHRDDARKRSWSEPAWRPKGPSVLGMLPETMATKSKRGRGYVVESADVQDTKYFDGKIATKTINDLRRLKQAGKPFFLGCGFVRPHLPFYAPKKYWDLYDADKIPLAKNRYSPRDAPAALRGSGEYNGYHLGDLKVNSDRWHRTMKHGYLACVSFVDALVGEVLSELDKLGLADNTIVVLWGDHGFHLGEHNFWGKHNTLDHAARVPLIIHVPAAVLPSGARGKKTASLVETIDLYPTLCELTQLTKPKAIQGKSLLPLLKDPTASVRDSVYCRFKSADTIFTEQFAYTRFDTKPGGRMLFDYNQDPHENRNVVGEENYLKTVTLLDHQLNERIKEAAGK